MAQGFLSLCHKVLWDLVSISEMIAKNYYTEFRIISSHLRRRIYNHKLSKWYKLMSSLVSIPTLLTKPAGISPNALLWKVSISHALSVLPSPLWVLYTCASSIYLLTAYTTPFSFFSTIHSISSAPLEVLLSCSYLPRTILKILLWWYTVISFYWQRKAYVL